MNIYPLFSNLPIISPTKPLITPSGLTAIKVCSLDILTSSSFGGDWKSFVIWNAWAVVMRVSTTVVMMRKSFGMHARGRFQSGLRYLKMKNSISSFLSLCGEMTWQVYTTFKILHCLGEISAFGEK